MAQWPAMAVVVRLSDRSKTNSMTLIIFSAEVFKDKSDHQEINMINGKQTQVQSNAGQENPG